MSITSNGTIGGPGTTPDDIALAAGMPRGSSAGHSLHPAADDRDALRRATHDASASAERLKDRAADIASQASEALNSAKDTAFSAASDVRDRVGRTADEVRDRASQAYDGARDWAADQKEIHRRRIGEFSDRGAERFQQGKSSVETFVSDNPLLVGVVGVAAGLLLGALLPRTRGEDQAVGPWADEMRDQGLRYARDLTSKGREFVESALDPEVVNAAAQRAANAAEGPSNADGARQH